MTVPRFAEDFYGDAFIADPLPRYEQLRALGPVVWLEQNGVYAVARDAEVRSVLRKPDIFLSGRGLSLNDDVNALLIGSTINSDGEGHARRRSVTARAIMPKNIAPLQNFIEETADALADRLVARGRFDAMTDFAQILPLAVVVDLIGLNEAGKPHMLKWAAATFNLFEGFNERSQAAFDDLVDLQAYLKEYGTRDALKEGGLAQRIFDVAPEKGFSEAEAAQLMRDYINPSLDTTISALGFAAYYFAKNPEQWTLLRQNPDLVGSAIEEIVRLSTPIRAFSRFVGEDAELSGVTIPKNSRIIAIYASANRDPDVWTDPNRFDIQRNTRQHMGFGHGVHSCMGMHLARLEMTCLLRAMIDKVASWHLDGTPEIAMNNTIRAFARLPIRVTPS